MQKVACIIKILLIPKPLQIIAENLSIWDLEGQKVLEDG